MCNLPALGYLNRQTPPGTVRAPLHPLHSAPRHFPELQPSQDRRRGTEGWGRRSLTAIMTVSSPWNLAMYLSPRFTSESLRGLKRHITLMLHSAGSAIFLAAGAGGREPLPAAQSWKKRAWAEGTRSRSRENQGSAASRFPRRGRPGNQNTKGRHRQPSPWGSLPIYHGSHGGGGTGWSFGGSSASPSPAWAGCEGWRDSGYREGGPVLPRESRLGPLFPHPSACRFAGCRAVTAKAAADPRRDSEMGGAQGPLRRRGGPDAPATNRCPRPDAPPPGSRSPPGGRRFKFF